MEYSSTTQATLVVRQTSFPVAGTRAGQVSDRGSVFSCTCEPGQALRVSVSMWAAVSTALFPAPFEALFEDRDVTLSTAALLFLLLKEPPCLKRPPADVFDGTRVQTGLIQRD